MTVDITKALDIQQEVRPHFPALKQDFIFADNAGGSQILQSSVDAITQYLLKSNVQLGGGYAHSVEAGALVDTGKEAAAALTNVEGGIDQIVLGSSTTQLAVNLSHACAVTGTGHGLFEVNDEIILCAADHEANVGPWVRLAKELNLTIKYWKPTQLPGSNSPFAIGLDPSELEPLLSANTRLIAFTATSNIMGHRTPVKEVIDLVKEKTGGRCMTMVDCVAYCAHGRMDMQAWGADAVLFSFYKLFGPHISCLAVSPWSPLASKSVHSLGHYFHPQSVAYKFAPGGASYELQVGCHAVLPYLLSLCDVESDLPQSRQLDIAFERIQAHEKLLSDRLLPYLLSDEAKAKGVRVIGPETSHDRAPTISFVVLAPAESNGTAANFKKRVLSKDVVTVFDEGKKIGVKYGHFYSTKILPCLPLDTSAPPPTLVFNKNNAWQPETDQDGVVRISLAHYNTLGDVDKIVEQLKKVL
ncbi:hypothetical protein QFC21_002393 [Naganishia friedmannii]|uniref:Uncharacterized protein n=1 Tax=Naganishia friedmannii TaxID=89922 RepID=A0ACC2VWU9_9TREE|nr:hypothetical protein QFC21_002393 [Naganishia friedmannii]